MPIATVNRPPLWKKSHTFATLVWRRRMSRRLAPHKFLTLVWRRARPAWPGLFRPRALLGDARAAREACGGGRQLADQQEACSRCLAEFTAEQLGDTSDAVDLHRRADPEDDARRPRERAADTTPLPWRAARAPSRRRRPPSRSAALRHGPRRPAHSAAPRARESRTFGVPPRAGRPRGPAAQPPVGCPAHRRRSQRRRSRLANRETTRHREANRRAASAVPRRRLRAPSGPALRQPPPTSRQAGRTTT